MLVSICVLQFETDQRERTTLSLDNLTFCPGLKSNNNQSATALILEFRF